MSSIECDNALMAKAPSKVTSETPPATSRKGKSDLNNPPKNLKDFRIPKVRISGEEVYK